MSVLKIKDSDTGESGLDIVSVPEGFSFQMFQHDMDDYISVIVSPSDAERIAQFLIQKEI